MARLAFSTWATQLVVAQRLSEAAWQPFNRQASEPDGMVVDAPAGAARGGRPRSERARRAILAAAAEMLLEQGVAHVSMGAVAERAGVSKATIYRWWPSKEMLALEALLDWTVAGETDTDTGSLREDLRRLPLRTAFERAVARGEISTELDIEAAVDLVYGPVYHRIIHGHAPVNESFATLVVDLALEGILG
jgi:AcrR family transcriptional regulator